MFFLVKAIFFLAYTLIFIHGVIGGSNFIKIKFVFKKVGRSRTKFFGSVLMTMIKSAALAALTILIPSIAFAAGGNLEPNDPVGSTFWLISIAMVAATVFFLMESLRVSGKWRTSLLLVVW